MPKPHNPPRSRYRELADLLSRGYPRPNAPGHVVLGNIFEELQRLVESDKRPKPEPARRAWRTLSELGQAPLWDGLVIGVGYNQPELVTPGIKLSRRLNLPKTAAMLQALRLLLPPPRTRDKDGWFFDPKRKAKLDQLEALYAH